jgi:hypothetical protein
MLAKVISDNGYKIELIRPLREFPLNLGAQVEIEVVQDSTNLVELFDKQLDEDTQARIMMQLKEVQAEVPAK